MSRVKVYLEPWLQIYKTPPHLFYFYFRSVLPLLAYHRGRCFRSRRRGYSGTSRRAWNAFQPSIPSFSTSIATENWPSTPVSSSHLAANPTLFGLSSISLSSVVPVWVMRLIRGLIRSGQYVRI